jgi:uncharacterized protein YjiS (DUF1127 family)
MTYATQTIHQPSALAGAGFLKRQWAAYWSRHTQRATVRILQDLDDAVLRDIGISRSEIESAVYGNPDDRRVHFSAS